MFGFGKKAKKKRWATESAAKVLGIQIELGRGSGADNFKEKGKDLFFHGYIFGFIDSLLQIAGINDKSESLGVMQEVHEKIFYSGVGQKILEIHVSSQGNDVFMAGVFKGGEEANEFMTAGSPPMGLAAFIQNGEE